MSAAHFRLADSAKPVRGDARRGRVAQAGSGQNSSAPCRCQNGSLMPSPESTRFLLTNDDGIVAPGLAALEAALPAGAVSTIVAPTAEHSACSHQVTTARPIRASRLDRRHIAVDSLPADCVRIALHELRDSFDWVLAGINHGANLGADIYYSGTVAAVREAALLGVPAIAVSHYRDRVLSVADWQRATDWVRKLLPGLLAKPIQKGEYWNVNLPCPVPGSADPPVVECAIDTNPVHLAYQVDGDHYSYRGVYSQRPRSPGRDVDVCFGGSIAVSLLRLP